MAVLAADKVIEGLTFKYGAHPPHRKGFSQGCAVKRVWPEAGRDVVVPMLQHIGAPCEPTVKAKDEVLRGAEIGRSDAFVSSPVHSPVNGVVKRVGDEPHPNGGKVKSVVITVGQDRPAEQEWRVFPGDFDIAGISREAICNAVRNAGVVGMGGAAFPTAVKLTWNPEKPIDTVILNGCECEPYLTSDHRLMIEAGPAIVAGLQLAMRTLEARRGIIAIEDNKGDAIRVISELINDVDGVQLAICKTKYPQGGEKQLINAVLGRVVPTGELPGDIGALVVNVGTAWAAAWACCEGRALAERVVTVTGKGVREPGNFMVPVGMLVSDLLEVACGGLTEDAEKVILGGPMMGTTAARLDVPVLKGTSGITVMSKDEVVKAKATACIRCGRCVDHCPLRLVPTRIAHAIQARDLATAEDYDLMACMECGCCSYVCPAQIPLLQYLRLGKVMVRQKAAGQ